jgi:probable blue pigment (indigoidine) exporter
VTTFPSIPERLRSVNPTILLSAFAPVAWGTTYLVTTELMPAERPLLTAAVRVLPIGLLLTLRARRLPRGAWWWRTAVLGALNIGVFQALLFVAAYRLPGGVAATAGAVQPLVVGVLAAWLLAERLRPGLVLAAVGGILGVGLLVLTPEARLDPVGVGAALAGTVSMAVGVVLTKRWGRPVDLVTATGWQLVAGGLLLAPLTLALEGFPPAFTMANWAGAAWLSVIGTGVAYLLWFRGIERLAVNHLSFLGLLSPLVATVLGWALLDQSLTGGQLTGAALIAVTVVATQAGATLTSKRAAPAVTATSISARKELTSCNPIALTDSQPQAPDVMSHLVAPDTYLLPNLYQAGPETFLPGQLHGDPRQGADGRGHRRPYPHPTNQPPPNREHDRDPARIIGHRSATSEEGSEERPRSPPH